VRCVDARPKTEKPRRYLDAIARAGLTEQPLNVIALRRFGDRRRRRHGPRGLAREQKLQDVELSRR
jgi:hypothetical protein